MSSFMPIRSYYPNVTATPFAFDRKTRKASGCLYDRTGFKIPSSERFNFSGGKKVGMANPTRIDIPSDVLRLNRKSIYLGHFMGRHYGHFLLETLSATWACRDETFDHYVFHPFIFGSDFPTFAKPIFDALGIDSAKILILQDLHVCFSDMYVPQRLVYSALDPAVHPAMAEVFALIKSKMGCASRQPSNKLYLSRSRLPVSRLRTSLMEELSTEKAFEHLGFETLHPQELNFRSQVHRFHNARVIAGHAGSALHNIVFCQPNVHLIHLCDSRQPRSMSTLQTSCNSLVNATHELVPWSPECPEDSPLKVSCKSKTQPTKRSAASTAA